MQNQDLSCLYIKEVHLLGIQLIVFQKPFERLVLKFQRYELLQYQYHCKHYGKLNSYPYFVTYTPTVALHWLKIRLM